MKKILDKNSVILAISMTKVIKEFHFVFFYRNIDCVKFKDNDDNTILLDSKVYEDNRLRPLEGQDILKKFENCEFFLETSDLTERLVRRRSINEITTNLCKIGNTITTYDISSKDFKDINEKFNNLFEEINNKYGIC